MPPIPIPYARAEPYNNRDYVRAMADLMLRRGDVAAAAALQRGQNSQQMYDRLGNITMATFAGIGQQRDEERDRAMRQATLEREYALEQQKMRDQAEERAIEQAYRRRQEERQTAPQGFTLGEGQVRYGPGGEVLATGPTKPPAETAFTLTPGGQRFDASGNVIASVPAAPSSAAGGFTLAPGGQRFDASGNRIASVPVAPAAPKDERIVSVIGPDGQPVYVRESAALGRTPGTVGGAERPSTEGERKAAGFHGQMQQALTNINRLEAQLTDRDLYQIQSLPQEGISGALNRGTMSEAAKRYIQAFNQFTEARLRPVSGAAIADSEYARDRATYGKQYGETPDLADQRQAARLKALEALRVMGGSAITSAPRPPGGTDGAVTVTAPNGTTYTFKSAAAAAAFKKQAGIP